MTRMSDHGKISKYFETKFRFVSNRFFSIVNFGFVSFQTVFSIVNFRFVSNRLSYSEISF